MHANGFVNLFVDLLPALDVVRREPAADALVLKVHVEAVSEFLIPGVADETGIELRKRSPSTRIAEKSRQQRMHHQLPSNRPLAVRNNIPTGADNLEIVRSAELVAGRVQCQKHS